MIWTTLAWALDADALDTLRQRAEATGSESLVVLHAGQPVLEYLPDGDSPQWAMSVTKSVVALALGHLDLDLETPVSRWYPDWEHGDAITLRHLLTHTSGLRERDTTWTIYASRNAIRHALRSPLVSPPGQVFRYNNNAVNLLGPIIQQESGKPLDAFVDEVLFTPLGIQDWTWTGDRSGPHVMAGLKIGGRDLAKLGQLVLDGGEHDGQPLLDRAWVEQLLDPSDRSSACGLLWWLTWQTEWVVDEAQVALWEARGMPDELVEPLRDLEGGVWTDWWDLRQAFVAQLDPAQQRAWRLEAPSRGVMLASRRSTRVAVSAQGYLGQYLVVMPDHDLVLVRQEADGDDPWSTFIEEVIGLLD